MNIDVTNKLIKSTLSDLLGAWLNKERLSPVYYSALVEYYKVLELKGLMADLESQLPEAFKEVTE